MSNGKALKSVLVADDQAFVRNLMVRMLNDMGYATQTASNGNEAMMALDFVTGALILDHQMDGMTGLEILHAVRTGETALERDFPILMLTGHAESDLVMRASALDVSAFLSKPVSKAKLGERMTYAMERKLALKPSVEYAAIKVPKAGGGQQETEDDPAKRLKEMLESPDTVAVEGPPQQLHYSLVEPGMVVVENFYSAGGTLLLEAGTELTMELIDQIAIKCAANTEIAVITVAQGRR
ncbi:MAG TPA: response regulator [Kiloniellaceae bacterium]|nr:response regulator [Kiloniellaceae bacterium]HIP80290.1 response regulator [Kiloniellaceae bacterium]